MKGVLRFRRCGFLFLYCESRNGCLHEQQAWSVDGYPCSGSFSTCSAFQVLCRLVIRINLCLQPFCYVVTAITCCLFLCAWVCCFSVCILLHFFICIAARIIEGPANHTVPIGATVTFHCIVQGEDAFWEINDTAINYPEDIIPFIQRGFSLREEYTDTTYNFTMTVNALPENNNTRITCLVYPLDYHSGRLTVMGKLIMTHCSVIILLHNHNCKNLVLNSI